MKEEKKKGCKWEDHVIGTNQPDKIWSSGEVDETWCVDDEGFEGNWNRGGFFVLQEHSSMLVSTPLSFLLAWNGTQRILFSFMATDRIIRLPSLPCCAALLFSFLYVPTAWSACFYAVHNLFPYFASSFFPAKYKITFVNFRIIWKVCFGINLTKNYG